MNRKFKRKSLSLLLTLAMIICLFFGLTAPASAASYPVTFTFDGPAGSVYVDCIPGPVTSASTDVNGALDFTVIPPAGSKVTSVIASDYDIDSVCCAVYSLSNVAGTVAVTVYTSAISYSGSWADIANRNTAWYTTYSGLTEMPIANAADLAAFAYEVNTDTNHDKFDNKIVNLTADIDLSAHGWVPIGGQWNNGNGYPPSSGINYFEGTFNGEGHCISGMWIDTAASGVGLFGYCCKGRIANLTVCGDVAVSNGYAAVGGIVGYTNGSIFNCISNVNVHCGNVSCVGGVAGVVENKCAEGNNAKKSLVQYCTNNGSVSSTSTRIGGVVGATYVTANNEDVINVDRCTNNGNVTTSSAAYKTFIGGIVGYCQCNISNCINTGTINATSGNDGHRMGGVVGILNGYSSIYANMANCVNLGTIINGYPNGDYDGALCYDESGTTVRNSVYIDTPYGVQKARGTHTYVFQYNDSQLKTSSYVYCDPYLNAAVPWDWSGITGDAYICDDGCYPYIDDSASSSVYYEHPEQLPYCDSGCACICTEPSGVYYDSDYTGDEEGTFDEPYNDLKTAVDEAVENESYTVVLLGPVTNTALNGVEFPDQTFYFKRSCEYGGYLFELSGDWDASELNLVIDGNASSCPGSSSLISVTGGTITLGEDVTLQNNKAGNNGAAIRMLGGTVNMSGTITGNSTAANGGGVAVMSDPVASTYGTFNLLTDGIISNNSATYGYGGGIYVSGGSTVSGRVYMTGGTIGGSDAGNSAIKGGGMYVNTHGTASVTDGDICYNTASVASGGGGVYVKNDRAYWYGDDLCVHDNTNGNITIEP